MLDTDGLAVDIVAPAGGLKAGQFYYDPTTGWAGAVLDTVDEGEAVALEIARGHRFEVSNGLTLSKGILLYIQNDGTLGTTSTARPFMKVYEVVSNVTASTHLVAGIVLPQSWAKFALS